MGEKSKKKAKKPQNDGDLTSTGAADTTAKEKKPKKSRDEQPALSGPAPAAGSEFGGEAAGEHGKDKKEKSKDGKRKRGVVDVLVGAQSPGETEEVKGDQDLEPPKKKKKEEGESGGDVQSEKKKDKKDKKDKKKRKHRAGGQIESEEAAVDHAQEASTETTGTGQGNRDKKKEKKPKQTADVSEAEVGKTAEDERIAEKKKKKRKHKDQDGDVGMVETSAVATDPKTSKPGKEREAVGHEKNAEKKEKKKKSQKPKAAEASEDAANEEAPPPARNAAPGPDLSERWNVQALGGGAKRQNKFMRLLGGKKHDATADAAPTGNDTKEAPRKRFDMGHVSQELEKQFDAGIRMKFEGGGQRRGLGA